MQQINYLKAEGGCPKAVIYECDDSGCERFLERDCAGDDWVEFSPSEDERQVARSIREQMNQPDGWVRLHHEQLLLTIDWSR
jgi:hypothetical protein